MKKLFATLAVFAAVLVFTAGCASVQVTQPTDLGGMKLAASDQTIAHINAQNWGLYLLSIPLITGSATKPGSIAWFSEDSVNVPQTVNILTQAAKDVNASKVIDVTSDRSSLTLPVPIPFLFSIKSTNVSGNAVR